MSRDALKRSRDQAQASLVLEISAEYFGQQLDVASMSWLSKPLIELASDAELAAKNQAITAPDYGQDYSFGANALI